MKSLLFAYVFVVGLFAAPNSLAQEETDAELSEKMLRLQHDYDFTGELKNCVPLHALKESKVIDDQTIFFRGPGKTAYLNKLPRTCSRLDVEERFAYQTSIGQLCSLDVITVVDNFGRSWNRCGLGKFEELKKKSDQNG